MRAHALAKKLLAMPNVEVGFSSHDNLEHEVQGRCNFISLLVKADVRRPTDVEGASMFDSLPPKIIVLRG